MHRDGKVFIMPEKVNYSCGKPYGKYVSKQGNKLAWQTLNETITKRKPENRWKNFSRWKTRKKWKIFSFSEGKIGFREASGYLCNTIGIFVWMTTIEQTLIRLTLTACVNVDLFYFFLITFDGDWREFWFKKLIKIWLNLFVFGSYGDGILWIVLSTR